MVPALNNVNGSLEIVLSCPPVTPWGDYLLQLLEARDMSLRSFAQLVGVSHNFLSRAMRGVENSRKVKARVKPPLSKLEFWATKLGLDEHERRRFIELAENEHAPERMAQRYREALARLAHLERLVEKLRAREEP